MSVLESQMPPVRRAQVNGIELAYYEGLSHAQIAERLERLAKEIALVLVEQNIRLALRICRYCYVMDRGHIGLEGPAGRIGDDPELVRLLAP